MAKRSSKTTSPAKKTRSSSRQEELYRKAFSDQVIETPEQTAKRAAEYDKAKAEWEKGKPSSC
ncbi:hypothetical protein ACRDNQ_02440 [Palleronia sp. KMU-117]|uniref:hypothetical protein n=1 Tax=Palleronia sp. KMU-117 TaxID=3434108 RepID=UPI003D74076B